MNDTTNTTAPDNLEGVLRRVTKLLAIAEDSRANPAEAAAAASQAEKIMRVYQIEHADVISAALKRGGEAVFGKADVGSTLDPTGKSKQASGWAGSLAVAVANLSDCQVRYTFTGEHGKTLRFQGYAADATMAKFTYLYLVTQLNMAGRKYSDENIVSAKDLTTFRAAFVYAVINLIERLIREKQEEMQAAVSSRALVLVKANAVAAHFGAVKYSKGSGHRGSADAWAKGTAAGSRVDVGRRAVGTNTNSNARIE